MGSNEKYLQQLIAMLLKAATEKERKRILEEEFEKQKEKILRRHDRFYIPRHDGNKEWFITRDLICGEAKGKYTELTLWKDGRTITRISSHHIGEVFAQLPPKKFMLIHESYFIHLSDIKEIQPNGITIVMKDGHEFDIARRRKKLFADRYLHF